MDPDFRVTIFHKISIKYVYNTLILLKKIYIIFMTYFYRNFMKIVTLKFEFINYLKI